MASYGEQVRIPGLLAGANLAAQQYKVVKLASTADEVIAASNGTTDFAIGILQNDPADGEVASVAVLGISKAIAGTSNLAAGEKVGYNSTAQVIDTTTDNRQILGFALDPSTAVGDIVRVVLTGPMRH